VEDEALVAIAMKDMLVELGFEVFGAYGKTADALAAANDHSVNAAVLDVNLGGELVYPVADFLVAKGIPFVFVTGYGAGTIEPRFAHVPVLPKPIERQALHGVFVVGTAREPKLGPHGCSDPVDAVTDRRELVHARKGVRTG